MKTSLILSAVFALTLTGCGDASKPNPPATAPSSAPVATNQPGESGLLSAPGDYLKATANAKHTADKAVDLAALNKALDLFNIQEGRYPKDLDELVAKKYFPSLPPLPAGMKLDYDAKEGTAKVTAE